MQTFFWTKNNGYTFGGKRLEIRGRVVKEGRILLIHFLYGLKPSPHISIVNIII